MLAEDESDSKQKITEITDFFLYHTIITLNLILEQTELGTNLRWQMTDDDEIRDFIRFINIEGWMFFVSGFNLWKCIKCSTRINENEVLVIWSRFWSGAWNILRHSNVWVGYLTYLTWFFLRKIEWFLFEFSLIISLTSILVHCSFCEWVEVGDSIINIKSNSSNRFKISDTGRFPFHRCFAVRSQINVWTKSVDSYRILTNLKKVKSKGSSRSTNV